MAILATPAALAAAMLGAVLATACGGGTAGIHAASKPSATSTLALSSAVLASTAVVSTSGAVASTTLLACHGEAFCREDLIAAGHEDTRADTAEDCTRRRGTVSQAPCPRDRALGACSLGGEAGPITVFTYAQENRAEQADALATMKDLCEQMSGELEVAAE